MASGDVKSNCEQSIEHFKTELSRMRSGRASTGLLEGIMVDYYGAQTPLIQLGMINAPEPRLVTVQVYDASAVESVEKAIQQADLGLNPSRDGNLVRVSIPALTEERRKELIKKLHALAEEARVAVRSHRRSAIDELKKQEKDKEISEDDSRREQESIQKTIDGYISQVDKLLEEKEKEMMEV